MANGGEGETVLGGSLHQLNGREPSSDAFSPNTSPKSKSPEEASYSTLASQVLLISSCSHTYFCISFFFGLQGISTFQYLIGVIHGQCGFITFQLSICETVLENLGKVTESGVGHD